LTACVGPPRVDFDGVAASEVVQRIKCELAVALPDVRGEYNPTKPFHWMKYWTAKVDLELQTTDTGVVTPTTTVLQPTLNLAVGIGGMLKTEAYRSDKISFTLSVDELMSITYLGSCDFARGRGLLGNLGLAEWVSSALGPVDSRALRVGYHQTPGKTAQIFGPLGRISTKGAPSAEDIVIDARLNDALKKIKEAETNAEAARIAAIKAKEAARHGQVGETFTYARVAGDRANASEAAIEQANVMIWQQSVAVFPTKLQNVDKVTDRAKAVGQQTTNAKTAAGAAWDLLPHDAPLDSITHEIKFTVNVSANVNPNWTLVHFRGPGQNPPFANAGTLRVHDLTIVLGEPDTPGGKDLSDEQRRQLLNAKIDSRGLLLIPQ
jgi:hypothetical protein